MRLLLADGATVDNTDSDYFPALWNLCEAPLPVLRLLLAAGADAAWEHDGVSIIEHLLQNHEGSRDIDGNVDLLARHGARIPKGEEGILLWQAPVWEWWTGGGCEPEEQISAEVVEWVPSGKVYAQRVYEGWMTTVMSGTWDQWGTMWRRPGLEPGCMCPICPLETTGGYREVRRAY